MRIDQNTKDQTDIKFRDKHTSSHGANAPGHDAQRTIYECARMIGSVEMVVVSVTLILTYCDVVRVAVSP